jgi:hypothetical protein
LKEVAVSSPSPTRRESKDVFLPSSWNRQDLESREFHINPIQFAEAE